jgi:cell division protease FtsH
LSDDLSALVDEETSRLVNEAHDRATEVLTRHREMLDDLSRILIVNEVIDGPDLHAYFEGTKPIPSPEDLAREAASNGDRRGAGDASGSTGPDIVVQPPGRG